MDPDEEDVGGSFHSSPLDLNADDGLQVIPEAQTRLVSIAELRGHKALADMAVLRRGNRLSITPVTPAEWRYITTRLLKD